MAKKRSISESLFNRLVDTVANDYRRAKKSGHRFDMDLQIRNIVKNNCSFLTDSEQGALVTEIAREIGRRGGQVTARRRAAGTLPGNPRSPERETPRSPRKPKPRQSCFGFMSTPTSHVP